MRRKPGYSRLEENSVPGQRYGGQLTRLRYFEHEVSETPAEYASARSLAQLADAQAAALGFGSLPGARPGARRKA